MAATTVSPWSSVRSSLDQSSGGHAAGEFLYNDVRPGPPCRASFRRPFDRQTTTVTSWRGQYSSPARFTLYAFYACRLHLVTSCLLTLSCYRLPHFSSTTLSDETVYRSVMHLGSNLCCTGAAG